MKSTATSAKHEPAAGLPVAPATAPELPAYTVETWAVERVKSNVRNARKHPKKQIEDLRSSFRKYGQVWPLLVREDGTVIAGHGRLEALKHEGFAQVRVIVATGWSEDQCRAFSLLDNKLALNSEWDEDLLGMELKDLQLAGVDLADLGFDTKELAHLAPPPPTSNAGAEGPKAAPLKSVIQFNIVFDDELQQQAWFGFVKRLKLQYPDAETLGARLASFIATMPPPIAAVPAPAPVGVGADAKG
jgi:hypothetical protein